MSENFSFFYISAKSYDSVDFFPHNTWDNFRVKLSPPLMLSGEWEVALIETILTDTSKVNKTLLNIHCSRIEGVIATGRNSNLLRTLFISSRKLQIHEFNVPVYVKADTGYIENIGIQIKRDDGLDIEPFAGEEQPNTICLLHFRKKNKI
jgi:hypothetical protein